MRLCVHSFKHKYLKFYLQHNLDGVFWVSSGFHDNTKLSYGDNGENVVSTF